MSDVNGAPSGLRRHLGHGEHVRVRAHHVRRAAQGRPGPAAALPLARGQVGYVIFGVSYAVKRPVEKPPLDPVALAWMLP